MFDYIFYTVFKAFKTRSDGSYLFGICAVTIIEAMVVVVSLKKIICVSDSLCHWINSSNDSLIRLLIGLLGGLLGVINQSIYSVDKIDELDDKWCKDSGYVRFLKLAVILLVLITFIALFTYFNIKSVKIMGKSVM